MYIGGWYDNYNFVGDIDELRISKVVRSADWVRLEYENQKPLQTAGGTAGAAGQQLRGLGKEDRPLGRQERCRDRHGQRRRKDLLDS